MDIRKKTDEDIYQVQNTYQQSQSAYFKILQSNDKLKINKKQWGMKNLYWGGLLLASFLGRRTRSILFSTIKFMKDSLRFKVSFFF